MKNFAKALLCTFALFAFVGVSSLQAQKISLMANIGTYNPEVVAPGTNIAYQGSIGGTLNARIFSKEKWAYRFGLGLNNLKYSVSGDDVSTNYDARRNDLQGVFGIERHFNVAFLDIYPGVYVPITVVGEDKLGQNLENIENGSLRAGLGVMAGAQIKLLKIFRVGLEFNATYNNFATAVRQSVNEVSTVPFKGMHYNTAFTLGIAL